MEDIYALKPASGEHRFFVCKLMMTTFNNLLMFRQCWKLRKINILNDYSCNHIYWNYSISYSKSKSKEYVDWMGLFLHRTYHTQIKPWLSHQSLYVCLSYDAFFWCRHLLSDVCGQGCILAWKIDRMGDTGLHYMKLPFPLSANIKRDISLILDSAMASFILEIIAKHGSPSKVNHVQGVPENLGFFLTHPLQPIPSLLATRSFKYLKGLRIAKMKNIFSSRKAFAKEFCNFNGIANFWKRVIII